jgi:cobaltochelatase CobS
MFTITAANRSAARKALQAATGQPASVVYGFTLAQLSQGLTDAYDALRAAHGTEKALDWVAQVRTMLDATPTPRTPREPRPEPVPAPDVPAPRKTPSPFSCKTPSPFNGHSGGILESAILAAVDAALDARPSVDRDTVEAIVRDLLKDNVLPPTSITITHRDVQREVTGVRHFMFETVLKTLSAGLHVWLPGPAGSGKSTLARQCGEALGLDVYMTGAIETPFQLLGYVSPNGDERTLHTPFRKAWERGGLFIFDDVDRSNAKALAAFNEALANGFCAFPDGVLKANDAFICGATANTYGLGGGGDYVGASRLDKATLDRFAFIAIPYDEAAEAQIAGREGAAWCRYVQTVRKAVDKLGIKHLVTPRSTYRGVRMLAAGLDRDTVERATVYAGLDNETVTRIKGALS